MEFLIHPTLNCNASCLHCGVSLPKQKINIEDLINSVYFLKSTLNPDKNQTKDTFIFHGGEPMLLGINYYENFINIINAKNENNYAMQTNLTLYDSLWGNLFNKYNISMSTSYDFFTDFRKLKNNESYFEKWKKNIKKYQDDTGKKAFVITVISKINLPYIEDIIDISNELQIHIKLNPLYSAGSASEFYNSISLSPKEYGEALIKAYRRWQRYRNNILFNQGITFENYIIYNKKMPCPYSRNCANNIIAILPNGDIYKCGICSQLQINKIGNTINKTINKKIISKIKLYSSVIPEECISCGICEGGCIIDFDNKNFTSQKTYYCESYKMFYNEVKNRVQNIIN